MIKRFIALFLAGILFTLFLNNWTPAKAQDPCNQAPSASLVFNPATDASTYRPPNVEQCDRPSDRAIIGVDNREPVLSEKFPWAAIGRIDRVINGEEIGQCTGTLIGRDLVLTNSHCLFYTNPDNNQIYPINQIVFKPSMIENDFVDKATVIERVAGWNDDFNNDSKDWALLKIDQPLGDKYGYLGWRALDFSDSNVLNTLHNQVTLAGYSGDYPTRQQKAEANLSGEEMGTAAVHTECNIEGSSEALGISISPDDGLARYGATREQVIEGLIIHNCDTTGGASGSAILAKFDDGNYYIIGLHAGWYPFDPLTIPSGSSQEECKITKRNEEGELIYDADNNLEYDSSVGVCRNRAVQASRWATQALAMREEA